MLKLRNAINYFALLMLFITSMVICAHKSYADKDTLNIRLGSHDEITRFVVEVPKEIQYNIFAIPSPNRIVADISISGDNLNINKAENSKGCIKSIRTGTSYSDKLRIVIDLNTPAYVKKSFLLAPSGGFGWRFVIDLEKVSQDIFLEKIGSINDIKSHNNPKSIQVNENGIDLITPPPSHREKAQIKPIIVIDAGHGGRDPGTIGVSGTKEKDITLAMAKQLKARLDKTGRYKVFLTRTKDKTMTLGQRVRKAKNLSGDLFISIHADSNRRSKTKGLSVYTLSETASDREAAELAEKENKADILTGMDLGNETPEVAGILIDLARRETMNQSAKLAASLLRDLRNEVSLLRNTHRFAGFAVLKSPTIPSVLVEVGYLSNKQEERLLRQPKHREKIARGIVNAIDKFFGSQSI
jgi:N-acetylmuramoyl-L-alanine amidase